MADDQMSDEEDVAGDSRLAFMSIFVLKGLRLKSEKWQKMLQTEDRYIVRNFLDTPSVTSITFHMNPSGLIQPYHGYCPSAKGKLVYFIRNSLQKITKDNYRLILIVGEISHETVKELTILTEEIFTPLLCNPLNQHGWPSLVIEDVKKHVYSFKSILYKVCGDMNNQVLLPMPAGIEKLDQAESDWIASCGEKMDIYLKSNIEGVVIQWVTQTKNLLKEHPSNVFKKEPFAFPSADLHFWRNRLRNLEGVYAQLKDPRVVKMATYLELTDSVYLPCFKTMMTNLITGVVEARDIVAHQKPLVSHFERVESTDFLECKSLIAPMIHCIGLLWGSSIYYCTTDKLIVLLQQVCNMVIEKCTSSCDPTSMFFGETVEQVIKIHQLISIIKYFIEILEKNKANVATFFSPTRIPIKWSFDTRKTFSRLFAFLERLQMVENILKTTVEMMKLEKVEFSGIRGRAFSNNTLLIYEMYTKLYQRMYQIQYNPLNPEDETFLKDYNRYLRKVSDIDQRLAKIFGEAFDETANLESLFKFLQIIGDLSNRPSINIELQPRHVKIITMMRKELTEVVIIFEEGTKNIKRTKGRGIIDPYYPPVAGVLWWTYKLYHRITRPMQYFAQVDSPIVTSPEALSMKDDYNSFIRRLEVFENELYKKWEERVPEICYKNMNACLLARVNTALKLNFDDELTCMLREIRYIQFLQKFTIPGDALTLYNRIEKLQDVIVKLNRAIDWYNNIRKGSHESDVSLIEREINKVDEMLKEGLHTLTWNHEIDTYVEQIFSMINKLQLRVLTAQSNMKKCLEGVRRWSTTPLYDRCKGERDGKPRLLAVEENAARERQRTLDIENSFRDIMRTIDENHELFFNLKNCKKLLHQELRSEPMIQEDGPSVDLLSVNWDSIATSISDSEDDEVSRNEHWKTYVDYIDSQICDILLSAIGMNLNIFSNNMDLERGPNIPFMEVLVHLEEPDIIFSPCLDDQECDCLQNRIYRMVEFIKDHAVLFKRVTPLTDRDNYLYEVNENANIKKMIDSIKESISYTIEDVSRYIQIYNKYSYLWLDEREEYLEVFLKYGKVVTKEVMEEMEQDDSELELAVERPNLDIYREQIEVFESVYRECEKLPSSRLFNGWLYLDMSSLKQALLNLVCKWGNMFKQDLVNFVHNSLNNMENFIEQSVTNLSMELLDNDYEGLLQVMACLIQVQEQQGGSTNSEFQLLRDVIELLKVYGLEFPEESVDQLEVLPEKWKNLTSLAAVVKHNVGPLQNKHAQIISKQVIHFSHQMQLYRGDFKYKKFFYNECEDVYSLINSTHIELLHFEEIAASLTKSCQLFDISPPDSKSILATRRELKMAKQLWDYYHLIQFTIEDWKKTPWKKIDAEGMDMECKRFSKDLRGLDKEMRTWEPYISIEATIKNLLTSLRAVTELQNPAIRDRHWIELMQATKNDSNDIEILRLVKIQMDEETTLAQLLSLNLHKFEDEVKNIVDKSVKEAAMEKTLGELEAIWSAMEFEYEEHERTKLRMAKVSEELVETLEDNQTQVQNMMASKFIGFFESEVSQWQRKLSNADQAINMWFEVQRKWLYLESIFVGSEDIRNQLPEDSKRFDNIDGLFKAMVIEMGTIPNVIEATNKHGLYDRLEFIHDGLVLCEKALNNYLETKRLAYPRFYFVSAADLLDILSNGNTPELVCKHLIKLYDNIAKLVFPKDAKNKIVGSKAYEMISKENDEHITFKTPCDCTGKVEVWLNRLTECMIETLHELLDRAVGVYDEKPRDQWIFDWGAQVALVATQIWWTMETNQAFAKLEEGYESALKEYQKRQISQLNALIVWLLGELSPGDRQKIMTICTIDVHCRDVVAKMIHAKIDSSSSFMWQSQLRHRWDTVENDCFGNICDAQFRYAYEYLGNTPRLVITPLTDRCYITLTQSLHLIMGGAPAGPAGTGKTETTKDLGRALGVMVYVFNCSEQMDYKSCGNIYKGLAQTGAWGCFDEFNRISVEVLSVVSVQVKSIQDAIRHKKVTFEFMGDMIVLKPTVGIFITMNPGYAGRTELPENIKSLFRPCAMVVPDFELICEIMLVAEGFQEARLLARKFITLYTLCRELLSKQDHYDWGLRAIKSVLVIAGSLKRGDRLRPEDQVLMRALRDFNIPKIVTDDVPVFMGLIGDLFPALDVPRKRDFEFEKMVQAAAVDMKLQPEPGFILKIVQLVELFAVRHSVFIIGFAGTGKTCVWKCLYRTYQMAKLKPYYNDLDPKAVTNDELFGVINPATREWKDGLFSVIMRDMANMGGEGSRWIILDGDIDPMWIESLNTLMDDNKVLTLASNERISLTKSMRLLFEISNLRTATPATVSRAGILYINPQDLGWNPYVASWIDSRDDATEKSILSILFDKYIPQLLESCKKYKRITPLTDIQQIQMVTYLLEHFLNKQNLPNDSPKEWYEMYFAFACVWGFGSALFQDQLLDWRCEFSRWFTSEFKTVKFPSSENVFDYYIDSRTKTFVPWSKRVERFEFDSDLPLQQCLVSTAETTRLRFFMDILLAKRHPIMLVGGVGCGKSVIVSDKLFSLPDNYCVTNVPFNFYTTSEMLQKILEKPLEKKSGRNYGPPGNKTMVYFVDDMNMPEVDKYGTVQPHTLIRQFMNYRHWYDRTKLTLKDIHNCQFVSCMNPTAGSFTIDLRLQRHFSVFAVSFPSTDACQHIYQQILSSHLNSENGRFSTPIQNICKTLVQATLALHNRVMTIFLPTAIKFHYLFNMRDLANIFQGLLFSTTDTVKCPSELVRLWMHETTRVYCDKLIDEKDIDTFQKLLMETVKKGFEELDESIIYEKPLIYCHFADGIGDPKYMPIKNYNHLTRLLDEGLSSYNDLVATMNLVLFEDAMQHICRINRILESPRGNALLIGVGGSGKQSLSRLSSFLSGLEVFQVQLRKGYNITDLKNDLAGIYLKSGLKNVGSVFLMTDAQVADEKFLVLINDLLASGEIPDLFMDDEVDNIVNGVRTETKAAGLHDTKDNCWKFFIDRVRKQLKVVLCFSPVGTKLRVRARKFPAIVNCTSIDWFHEWPQEALRSVSKKFLSELEVLPQNLMESVALFMAHVHTTVNIMSTAYYQNERRFNYTTPKSFLEQISLFSKLLREKNDELKLKIKRLENGLLKLESCAKDVQKLKATLAAQELLLKEKNKAAEELISVVGAESEKVSKEKALAAEEEKRVKVIEEDVSIKAKICADDLAKAEPALVAAQEALNTLNKNNLTELKSFGTPPDAVVNVTAAVSVLLAKNKIPKDRSWKACKIMMAKVDQFLYDLVNYDKENIHPEIVKAIQPYIKDPEFLPETIVSKSSAAAGLCAWVINIMKFYEVYVIVEPKRKALASANAELAAARSTLAHLKDKISELEQRLSVLLGNFQEAVNEKLKCQAEADATNHTIDLANRLVNGLASEKVRWTVSAASLRDCGKMLPGDVLLITAYISYVGCFTHSYRLELLNNQWIPFLYRAEPKIPITENLDPMSVMTDDAQVAAWNNEGLPADRMSTDNAIILTHSARWPLIIDPQLQGIKWIKNHYSSQLVTVRLTSVSYLEVIERAIVSGDVLLIESIGETVEAVLDPLLGRQLIKKGKVIKIGDKEIDYNPKFRLIIQTKIANPHYQPEMQAQCTLINFTVTRDGLEEQLLGEVVKAERPDLESLRADLTKQQNDFKISLKSLEDDLLCRLSSAGPDILNDSALVINLETTKKTAAKIETKVKEAKVTSVKIDEAREHYRPAAERASLLYFILTDLSKINPIYQFSLKAYNVVFKDALTKALPETRLAQRVTNLLDSITYSVFLYTSRGLFECDKLIFLCQIALQIQFSSDEVSHEELDFLLRYNIKPLPSMIPWLSDQAWSGILTLSKMEEFHNLDKDIESASKRWQKFSEGEAPEKDKFPGEWKNKTALQRLCIMRALRPDRMTYATRYYIREQLGAKFVEARTIKFAKSYEEMSPSTPIFFILSPGVDPLKDVEKLGESFGFTLDGHNFHIVSLGQGQESVAERAMEEGAERGHWVMLQNIHLVSKWLPTLEKRVEQYSEGSHQDYRLFLTAEPAAAPEYHIIPQGILESAIKITNEPSTGMQANLHKALDNFSQDTLEMCSKEAEFKSILFALCYFHSVVIERGKFGPQGWNRNYPFNIGDLMISVHVLYNYLENNSRVPWEDLRYLFGEIMYGGHITDDWDRRLCRTYLSEYMQPELIDGELYLAPGFLAPPNCEYSGYHSYIDDSLPAETPYLYGLHPNAEIGVLTTMSDHLFRTIFEMQPRDGATQGGSGMSREEKMKAVLEDILDKVPEPFNISELMVKVEERSPYVVVALQECDRMNILMGEIKRSLKELDLGLKGELTITSEMEELQSCLLVGQVPPSWTHRAYPSMLPLPSWFTDLCLRLTELESWAADFTLPTVVWLGGFFNPQSFLTAIMQQTARRNEWPLDKMCLNCDVTKKHKDDIASPPKEGAYVHGLYIEGARWDVEMGTIVESRLKELFPTMPVIYIKAVTQDKQDIKNVYDCPVYKIRKRGPTYVWTFNLRTRERPSKWTLAGVCLLLGT